MSVAASYTGVTLLSIVICYTRLVNGQFTSPRDEILYVREFTDVTIPWSYNIQGNLDEIRWSYKTGAGRFKRIYSVDDNGVPALQVVQPNKFTGRLSYKGSLQDNEATLGIERFTKEDEGKFKCEVIGQNPIEDTVELRVIVVSNVTAFKAVENDVKEGDNVTLSCTVTKGIPSPRIAILRGNQELNQTDGSEMTETTLNYAFRNISRESKGLYSCRVTTQDIKSTKDYQLQVKYPPKLDKSISRQYGCIDKMVTIVCKADANPMSDVRRIGPNGEMISDEQFLLKTFGVYRCEANNSLGNDSHNITVSEVKGRPEKPSFAKECLFKELSWKQMTDEVNFTLQYSEEGSERTWFDVITTPDPSYSPSTNESFSNQKDYYFRLIAQNCVGKSEPSDECLLRGEGSPSSGKRSGPSAGVIAGSVIAALVGILIIVIVVVIVMKRKKNGSFGGSKREDKQPIGDTSRNKPALKESIKDKRKQPVEGDGGSEILTDVNEKKTTAQRKPGELLYADVLHDPNESPSRRSQSSQPTNYAEISHPDDPSAPSESAGNSHYANNIPSWV